MATKVEQLHLHFFAETGHQIPPRPKRVWINKLAKKLTKQGEEWYRLLGEYELAFLEWLEAKLQQSREDGMNVDIRWMIRRDMPSVLKIEAESFENPWSEEEFIRCLRQRNVIGMVAEAVVSSKGHCGSVLAGYMIYELHANRLHLLNFAVDPLCRRAGVGTAMIDKIKSKLTPDRRNRLMLEVRESNLIAQLFFKSQGLWATSVLRNYYEDSSEDAYLMLWRHPSRVPTA